MPRFDLRVVFITGWIHRAPAAQRSGLGRVIHKPFTAEAVRFVLHSPPRRLKAASGYRPGRGGDARWFTAEDLSARSRCAWAKRTRTRSLPVTYVHALRAGELPRHHHDPFDRLLVAQAQLEGLRLVTDDPQIKRYEVDILEP